MLKFCLFTIGLLKFSNGNTLADDNDKIKLERLKIAASDSMLFWFGKNWQSRRDQAKFISGNVCFFVEISIWSILFKWILILMCKKVFFIKVKKENNNTDFLLIN